ncbi:MAG: hypothetical protein ACLFNT_01165 [Spirochaetales bacterium]
MRFDYVPFFCEENIYRLAASRLALEPEVASAASRATVIFISNQARQVLVSRQKAGRGPLHVVIWDYHVVYEEAGMLFDLDSTLDCPIRCDQWIEATFPAAVLKAYPELAPRFVIVPAQDFVGSFTTDRRHMRRSDGSYRSPPPGWPAPTAAGSAHNLDSFIEGRHESVSRVTDLETMRAAWR